MAILKIAKMGHPVLRRVAARVEDPSDSEIVRLAADMRETLEDIGASGLAAPQVFVEKRVVVYRMIASRIPDDSDIEPVPWTVMVNPEITPLTPDQVLIWERCLSIPGLHGKVPRFPRVSIRYQTLECETVEQEAHSTWAALLQHECDHLDGMLYPMRMDDLSMLAFNDAPGPLAEEAARYPNRLDPLFLDLVERWPTRAQWLQPIPK
jgi:peptide deformylase